MAAVEEVTARQLDEAKLRQLIRAEFEATDDYQLAFQRAVQAVMQETGLSGVEARWLVMRLQAGRPAITGE